MKLTGEPAETRRDQRIKSRDDGNYTLETAFSFNRLSLQKWCATKCASRLAQPFDNSLKRAAISRLLLRSNSISDGVSIRGV